MALAFSGNKKGAEYTAEISVFIILLLVAVAVIFYVISVPPEAREALIGTINVPGVSYSHIVLDVSPGLLAAQIAGETKETNHNLASISVDNNPQAETKALSTQFLVKRSLVSDMPADFNFQITDKAKISAANLEFLVADRQESGNLIVTLNEKVVYSARLEAGQKTTVVLPTDLVKQGTNNLKIYAEGAGARFWATNFYSLSDLNLILYKYSEQTIKTQTFSLAQNELVGISSATLSAFVRQTSENSAELTAALNGQEIYKAVPSLAATLSIELQTDILQNSNILQWVVAKDGKYVIEFGKVTTESTFVPTVARTYTFVINEKEASNIADKIYKCELLIEGTGTLDVDINGNSKLYIITEQTTDNVCKLLKAGSNPITLSAKEDMRVETLSITIKS